MEVINHRSLNNLNSKSGNNETNNAEINKQFLDACKNGNKSLMKKYHSQISSIDIKEKDTGNTALHLACINGHEKIAQSLIKYGINIDETNSEGFVALYYAIYNGLVSTVKILLDHGSYMECLDKYGNSILHIACELGYLEIVKYLLEKKILNNHKNNSYKTPLHIACQKGFLDIIRLMLYHHNDMLIDDIEGNGKTPLILACENNHLSTVKHLINSGCNIYIRDNSGKSAIYYACNINNTDMIKTLINVHADIMQYDNNTIYPLHLLCKNGNLEMVKLFVETLNADLECRDNNGYTPLYVAYINHQSQIIKYLIGKGCNVDSQNNDGVAILHYCCMIDCADSLKYFNNSNQMTLKRHKKGGSRSSSRSYLLEDTQYCSVEELSNFSTHNNSKRNSISHSKKEKNQNKGDNGEKKKLLKTVASKIKLKKLISKSKIDMENENENENANELKNKKKTKSTYLENENNNSKNKSKSMKEIGTTEEENTSSKKSKLGRFNFGKKSKSKINLDTKKSESNLGKEVDINGYTDTTKNNNNKSTTLNSETLPNNPEEHHGSMAIKSLARSLYNIKKNKINDSRSSFLHLTRSQLNSTSSLNAGNNLYFTNELEYIEILIDNNANINIKDNDGNTPLMIACAFRRIEQINLLLRKGANTEDTNNEGISALDFLCFDKELGLKRSEINICHASQQDNCIKYLIQRNATLTDINYKNDKFTPLHLACYNNNLEMIKYILERGNDINACDCNMNTPFHILCKKGYSSILKELFEMKQDIHIDAQNILGKTGMHYACQNQDVLTIKLLLEHNVNLRLVDNSGNNALHIACAVNNSEIIDLLLNHIISEFNNDDKSEELPPPSENDSFVNNEMEIINCFNKNHETPIFLALKNGNIKIVNKLLHLHNIDITFEDKENQNTLLHLACEKEIVSIAQSLSWLSVDPNIQNKNGNTPLHIACQKGSLDLINVLLNFKNLNVNIQNKDKETPLHIACNNKSEDICRFILDKKVDLNLEDSHGHTAFFVACKQGLYRVVKKMIKLGIDIHQRDNKGYTALHIAAAYERVPVIKLLIDHNADVYQDNPFNNISPYDIIMESQNRNILNIIENNTKEVKTKRVSNTAINTHVIDNSSKSYSDYKSEALNFMFNSVGSTPSISKIRNSRSDNHLKKLLETTNNNNIEEATTPLHRACEDGYELKVNVFLDYGDDLNLVDSYDNTPLLYACTYNRINVVKILLQNPKTDINIKCCQSRVTPFLCAAYNKNADMINLLLDNGANINACDSNGASALFNLCRDDNIEIYRLLLDRHINVKIQDKSGMTILHQIALTNQKELAELILNYDSSIINYQDIYGKTALHYCSINNYRDIIKILLNHKANIKIKDKKKNTAVDYMKDNNAYTDDLKEMIKAMEYSEIKDFNLHSCQLIQACKKGDIETVKKCLELLGDNIYYVDDYGRIALHYACEKGNIEIVKLLLAKGSCINVYDDKFFTPLYLASFNGYYDISKLLLENGASSNNIDFNTFKKIERLQENSNNKDFSTGMSKYNDIEEFLKFQSKKTQVAKEKPKKLKEDKSYLRLSSTPLISAILNGQNDIVEELIKNGTNVNEKDEQDLNPFYYACSINNVKAIHLLIDKKVEIENYCDPLKTSIMHFACKYGNVELAEIIMNCFAIFQGNISQSSIYLSRSHSKELSIERYCGVNEYNRPNLFGVTPFHWACLYGKHNIIKLFKNAGIEVFLDKDINGNTALHHVCNSGNTESVRLVLKYIKMYNEKDEMPSINIDELNNEGHSALHIAVTKGNEEVVKLLIDNGINQNLLNKNNQTAKQYAESLRIDNKKILELLK